MNKNIQQLAAMVAVLQKSLGNKCMKEIISVYASHHFETTIHVRTEFFLSTFKEYEKAVHTNETDEIFVHVEGIKVFTVVDKEGVPNA